MGARWLVLAWVRSMGAHSMGLQQACGRLLDRQPPQGWVQEQLHCWTVLVLHLQINRSISEVRMSRGFPSPCICMCGFQMDK